MNEQSINNKKAWEYRAYEFWNKRDGAPLDKANKILKNPRKCLKKHKEYFNDIDRLMNLLYSLLKHEGRMILSDFHPLKKFFDNDGKINVEVNYFDKDLRKDDLAYKQFFSEEEQKDFPDVSIRLYTISEIINSVVEAGFTLKKFEEHPGWNNENIPWEFTILADK